MCGNHESTMDEQMDGEMDRAIPCPPATLLAGDKIQLLINCLLTIDILLSDYFGMPVIFSRDQAVLWMVSSVCLSIRLSICLSVMPFSPCYSFCIIMKFSGIVTIDKSDVHAKGQSQRSKVKVINEQNHIRLPNFMLDNSLPLHFMSCLWCHKQFYDVVACIVSAKQWLVGFLVYKFHIVIFN